MKSWLMKKDKPDEMGIAWSNIEKIGIVSMFPITLGLMYLINVGVNH